ncbi:MAG TPA: hypothetical protein VMG12_20735 [Polyangiaceae bacterium]|nr:hypothetical protein [Polyangiaceae bacterium]
MAAPRYDTSRWPLVSITLSSIEMTDAELDHYLNWMDQLFERGSKFAVLLDYRQAPDMKAKRRQLIGERSRAAMERHPGQLVAFAFVISSALQRGIFTAILWLSRSGDTARVFAGLSEGETWLASRLQSVGLEPRAMSRAPRAS